MFHVEHRSKPASRYDVPRGTSSINQRIRRPNSSSPRHQTTTGPAQHLEISARFDSAKSGSSVGNLDKTTASTRHPERSTASIVSSVWLMVPNPARPTITIGKPRTLANDAISAVSVIGTRHPPAPSTKTTSWSKRWLTRCWMASKSTTACSARAATNGAAGNRNRNIVTSSPTCQPPAAAASRSPSAGISSPFSRTAQPVSIGLYANTVPL